MERLGSLQPRLGYGCKRLFDTDEVEQAAERIERTGRALPSNDRANSTAPDNEAIEELREQLRRAVRRIAELEQQKRVDRIGHERLRVLLIDAVDDIVAAATPRDRALIAALEKLVVLLSDNS